MENIRVGLGIYIMYLAVHTWMDTCELRRWVTTQRSVIGSGGLRWLVSEASPGMCAILTLISIIIGDGLALPLELCIL